MRDDGREPDRYLTLDAMRGVAALMVVAFHLQQRWNGDAFAGYLAVDLFLALSGFVIATNYSDRFAGGLSVARFIQIRLIRLYPLYLFGFVLGMPCSRPAIPCKSGRGPRRGRRSARWRSAP